MSVESDPFTDPFEVELHDARGRTAIRSKSSQMDPEIQEVRVVDTKRKSSRSAAPASSQPPPVPPKKRSASQDNVTQAAAVVEKARAVKSGKASKKGGLHVDVIDRLDYSGVGPATFHHDGPFDACAPSRNRHKNKAPMLAWGADQDPQVEKGGVPNAPPKPPKAVPMLETLDNMRTNDSPYGAVSSPTSKKKKSGPKDDPFEYPRRSPSPKRRDTLADAWGRGEPEPFEEFFAETVSPAAIGHGESGLASAASSLRNYKVSDGVDSASTGNGKSRRTNGGVRRPTNRPPLPPPQPIFPEVSTAGPGDEEPFSSDMALSTSAGGMPRRSKSLMQRIKKMRDAPNVPVDHDEPTYDNSGSSSENHMNTTRPTHKSQNSILGRLGNKSPTSPSFGDSAGEKALPLPPSVSPGDQNAGGYFDRGVGRKASIMQKVRGVVVGKSR